jgi:hypothetical protein
MIKMMNAMITKMIKKMKKYFDLALWLPFCHNSICSGTLALVLASA